MPTSKYSQNKSFIEIAQQVEKLPSLEKLVEVGSTESYVFSSQLLPKGCNEIKRNVLVKSLQLYHPTFFSEVQNPLILLFNSPENSAITIGRIVDKDNPTSFQLPRFHTGVPAQRDLELAVSQMLSAPQLANFLVNQDLDQSMYIVSLIREGHLTFIQQAIFAQTGISVPLTLVHVHHIPDPDSTSKLNRLAAVCDINLEGLNPKKIKTLIISDNVASGIQVGVTLIDIMNYIKIKGGQLETIIVVAPLLTLFSAIALASLIARHKIRVIFLVCEGLLTNRDNERYFSPLTNNPKLVVNQQLMQLHHAAHPKKIRYQACVRCNWTASFLAPNQAIIDSDHELRDLGSSNDEVEWSQQLALSQKQFIKLDHQLLTPDSVINYRSK